MVIQDREKIRIRTIAGNFIQIEIPSLAKNSCPSGTLPIHRESVFK